MMDVQIFIPGRSDGEFISDGLRALTKAICDADPEQDGSGGLGGSYGYGCNFENDVFMMHRYCWCEKPECLWCTIWLSNEVDCTENEAKAHREKQTAEIKEKYGDWAAKYPGAPHFWHKPSGIQVRWYKWIGRDNEISSEGNWPAIIAECIASVAPTPTEE